MSNIQLFNADCLDILKTLPDNSISSCVTDPPSGCLGFMGKAWDQDKGGRDHWIKWLQEIMVEVHRVLKPGGHMLCWAIPRGSHWTATAIENAGFEIRDIINHAFFSGFPKSLNVGKAIDATIKNGKSNPQSLRQDRMGENYQPTGQEDYKLGRAFGKIEPDYPSIDTQDMGFGFKRVPRERESTLETDDAKQWSGFGTALKPAIEHYILARKPCSEKTVAKNVLRYGTGSLNIDGSRIGVSGGGTNCNNRDEDGNCIGHDVTSSYGQTTHTKNNISNKQYRVNNGKLEQYVTINKEETGTNTFRQGKWEWKVVDDIKAYREIEVEEVNPNHRNSSGSYELGFQGGKSDGKRLVKKIQFKQHDNSNSGNTPTYGTYAEIQWQDFQPEQIGRFPANLILSHADECIEGESCVEGCPALELDRQSGISKSVGGTGKIKMDSATNTGGGNNYFSFGDKGGASRFFANFYAPKISTRERNMNLDDVEATIIEGRDEGQDKRNVPHKKRPILTKNDHPTLKTIKLMKYLITLINPPGGIVIDPFAGTFSTGLACQSLGVDFIGIEKDEHYFEIGKKRMKQ